MQLTLVVEGSKGPDLVKRVICLMQRQPLAQIIADPEIQTEYQRLRENHVRNIDVIRKPAHAITA